MIELYQTAFSAVNLPYTILLLVILAYWMLVIIGLLDIDAFDIDLSTDFDADLDLDAPDHIPGLGAQAIGFLNIGEVPVMFYVSLVTLSMWVGSIRANELLGNDNIWIAIALAVPNLIVGLLVAKLLTTPFKWLNIRKDEKNEFEGVQCLVSSMEITDGFGECEIQDAESPIKIFARTAGGEVLHKGDTAEIVQRISPEDNVYLVKKYERET